MELIAHIPRDTFEHVYEPREDTFLFLDALEQEKEFLVKLVQPTICLEIGPGSGVVSAFVSTLLEEQHAVFLSCDINPKAAATARETIQRACKKQHHVADTVIGDLCSPFGSRIDGRVDLLLFNPPYVVTDEDEVGCSDIRAAWAGGVNGMAVTSRFLPCISKLLSPQGACYMVLLQENDPLSIAKKLAEDQWLMPKMIMKKTAKNERLSVWRFTHRKRK